MHPNLEPKVPWPSVLKKLPMPAKRVLSRSYWIAHDSVDFVAEAIGWCPSHALRLFLWRRLLRVRIGSGTSIHRGCRFYHPSRVQIGTHSVINRDVLLDGRMGVQVGDNVSISEGTLVFTLEHDPNSPSFENRGGPVTIGNRAFLGSRVVVLPGVTIEKGAVVAAGAVVSSDVSAYSVVGGVPARPIGERSRDLHYELNYRKFLG